MQRSRPLVVSTLISVILAISAATAIAQTTATIADGETREETTANKLPDSVVVESGGTLDLQANQSIDSLDLQSDGRVELKNSATLTLGDNDGDSQINGDIRAFEGGGDLELSGSGTFDINADLSPSILSISGDQTTVNFNKTDALSFGTSGFNVTGPSTINLNAENVFTQEGARTLIFDQTDNQAIDFNIKADNLISGDSSAGSQFKTGHATVINIAEGKTLEFEGLYLEHKGALSGKGDLVINNPYRAYATLGSSSAPASTHTGSVLISNVDGAVGFFINEGSLAASKKLSFNNAGIEGSSTLPEIKPGALNQSLALDLTESHIRFENGAAHEINELTLDAESTIEIVSGAELSIGHSDGASNINGTIQGPGSLTIARTPKSMGSTTIGGSGQVTNGLTAGDAITMINNGTISRAEETVATTVDGSDNATAHDITITNTGTIEATVDNNALYLRDSDRANINNSGTIEANGATGIHLKLSDRANIVNSGNIIAGTDNGIFLEESTNAYVENSGKIQVAGDDGIDLEDSSNAQVINSGTISAGNNVGVNLIGSTNATVTNSSTISVTGNNGILLKGSTGAVIENSGLITANRNAIDGADADTVTNATIINSGVLRTQNQTVALNGDHTLRNSGNIEATVAGEDAIHAGNDGGTVVILEKGSRVIGGISSGSADNTLRINVGSAQSIMYETTGDWALESLDGRPVVEGSVMTVGVGNLETVDEQMHRRSVDLRDSLSRLDHQAAMAPGAPILVDAYTGQEDRGASNGSAGAGLLPAYTLDTNGLTLATELGNPDRPVRLFINYTDHELDIDDDTHRIDSQGVRIGASMASLISAGPLQIGGRIAIGRNDHEGDREVLINTIGSSGVMRQEADWESDTWEVALDARYRQPLSETTTLTLTPELGIQEERIDGYTESAQFDWDSRNVMQGRAALDAALDYQASEQTRLSAALSVWYREVIDGETADYTLAGTRVSYTDPQTDGNGLSARLRFERQISESIALAATAAGYGTNENTDGWTFGVSLMSRF